MDKIHRAMSWDSSIKYDCNIMRKPQVTLKCGPAPVFSLLYDQPHGLAVRASGYKSRGPGFDSQLYHADFPCGGRIPVVTMVWVVSRIRFKVETSLMRSHTSINSWLNPRQRSPRWRGPHHDRQPAHQLTEYPSTLIADYGREKKKFTACRYTENLYFSLPLLFNPSVFTHKYIVPAIVIYVVKVPMMDWFNLKHVTTE